MRARSLEGNNLESLACDLAFDDHVDGLGLRGTREMERYSSGRLRASVLPSYSENFGIAVGAEIVVSAEPGDIAKALKSF
jgi:hypothetical protein